MKISKILFSSKNAATVIPGILIAGAITLLSFLVEIYLDVLFKTQFNIEKCPVSIFLLAIILGTVATNTIKLPESFTLGIKFCVSSLLKFGIMLLGIRLSISYMVNVGMASVIVIIACIISGIGVSYIFSRLFGIPSRLGTLIGAGTSICGISAIVATSPAIGAKEEETSYAISIITVFGLFATITYPYLLELASGFNTKQAGIFIGTAIHDTAQVIGAAYAYDQLWSKEASAIAVTTKLVRNSFLIIVVPVSSILFIKQNRECKIATERVNIINLFPKFILGFLAFVIFRSIGDILILDQSKSFLFWSSDESWTDACDTIKTSAKYILTLALAGAGLNTKFAKLKKLSFKPFLIGLIVSLTVGLVSFTLILTLKDHINYLIVDKY